MTLHTPDEIAAILHISKTQVLLYIQSGKLKAKRLSPRIIRVTEKALAEFLNDAK